MSETVASAIRLKLAVVLIALMVLMIVVLMVSMIVILMVLIQPKDFFSGGSSGASPIRTNTTRGTVAT